MFLFDKYQQSVFGTEPNIKNTTTSTLETRSDINVNCGVVSAGSSHEATLPHPIPAVQLIDRSESKVEYILD